MEEVCIVFECKLVIDLEFSVLYDEGIEGYVDCECIELEFECTYFTDEIELGGNW